MIATLELEEQEKKNKKRALAAALFFVFLVIVFLFMVKLSIPDPPLQEELLELEVDMGSTPIGGSPGSEQENVSPQPQPVNQTETQEIKTQDDESVYVPSSKGTTESKTETTTERQPDETWNFGQFGDGGQGGGQGGKLGDGDGDGGSGAGNGSGDGYNPNRKQLKGACVDGLDSQIEGTIALDIWVDDNGKVIRTQYNEGKSNTGNQDLIKLAQKATKCMKYEARPGTGTEKVKTAVFRFKKQ